MYKSAQELEQEAIARIEKLYLEAETVCLLRQHQALPRQHIAALLRKLDLPTTTPARIVRKVNQ
jgi:hypothetical protein